MRECVCVLFTDEHSAVVQPEDVVEDIPLARVWDRLMQHECLGKLQGIDIHLQQQTGSMLGMARKWGIRT